MPVISGQERSPSARPGGARRPITATPPLRPVLDHKASTEATHPRLQHGAAYFKAARRANTPRAECRIRSTQPRRALELSRAPQAQDKAPRQEGSKIASRAARNKRKQPAFANDKCDAHRACRCGGIAERDERLAVFVLRNNSTAEKGVRGNGRFQGKQRVAAPPASQARLGGLCGNAPPRYVNRTSWANSEDSRGARAQGRPSNRKSEHHLRVHRAALRPRLPRPVLP